jgi:hypothetical protein
MPRTKSGEVITYKEFMKRWKEGMQNLTPAQRTSNDIGSTWVTLIGFIVALVALLFFNETFGAVVYGLILIFIGSVYSNIVKLFSLYGQYKLFKSMERTVEEEIPTLEDNEKEVKQ